jgi:excisionase family DNA binding protein
MQNNPPKPTLLLTATQAAESLAISNARLLDVKVVAELLDCSSRHVYRLSDAGRMPAPVRLGSLVRWSRPAIETWIADGCPPTRNAGRTGR